jgi:hypothetical protein
MTGVFQLYGDPMQLYGDNLVLYLVPPVVVPSGAGVLLRRRRRVRR